MQLTFQAVAYKSKIFYIKTNFLCPIKVAVRQQPIAVKYGKNTPPIVKSPCPKDSICDECGKVMSKDALSNHRKSHLPIAERPFECDKCGLRLTTASWLKKHIDRVHNRILNKVCQHCGKAFYDKHGLNKHVAHVHEGKKPHKCPNCGKGML